MEMSIRVRNRSILQYIEQSFLSLHLTATLQYPHTRHGEVHFYVQLHTYNNSPDWLLHTLCS